MKFLWSGRPMGISHSLTTVNMGNSGAPLLNMKGGIVGGMSHIMSQSGGSEGLGFGVTASVVQQLLLEQKALWTGIDFFPLAGNFAQAFYLPQNAGLLVQRAGSDSPSP